MFLTTGRQGMPPTAGGPQRLSLPRTPLLGLPHTQDRSAEGQPPLGRTHSPPQAEGDEAPPPQSHLSRARRLQPPGSRPHRTRWVPAQGEVCSHEGEGRGGSQGKRRERLPGVRTTLKGEERELREVKPYLPSRDPPLRVTRPAVHCGGQGVAFLPGSPASNVAGARRDQAPPPSLRLARANQVLWEGYADPPPPGGPM